MRLKIKAAVLLLLILLASGGAAAQSGGDIAGTWVLASREVGRPQGVRYEMTLSRRGNSVMVETKITGSRGVEIIRDCMELSGGPTEFTARMADACACQDDGKSPQTPAEGHAPATPVEGAARETRRWSLSPDGDRLTEEVTLGVPSTEVKARRVYVRR